MIIQYPEHLPKPLRDSSVTTEEYFKRSEESDFFYQVERIIRKNNSIVLKFTFDKLEYIDFEDLYFSDMEEGMHNLQILVNDGKGNIKEMIGDIIGGLDVEVTPNYFNVSCVFIIKNDII